MPSCMGRTAWDLGPIPTDQPPADNHRFDLEKERHMKKSNSSTITVNRSEAVQQARRRVTAAEALVETAKQEWRTAKERRSEAKKAARRAKKRFQRAKDELAEAEQAVIDAEAIRFRVVKPIMPIKAVTAAAPPAKRVRVRRRRKPAQVKRTSEETVSDAETPTPTPEFQAAGVSELTDFTITAEPVIASEDNGAA
ncbi:MAG: hypothetical protein ACJ8M1_02740 [Chthoniobacterales bacterium]